MATQGLFRLAAAARRRQPGAVRLVADAASEASGRVYAAYGGVYISMALLWLWLADGVRPVASDWIGAGLCLAGMLVIMFGPRSG